MYVLPIVILILWTSGFTSAYLKFITTIYVGYDVNIIIKYVAELSNSKFLPILQAKTFYANSLGYA